MTFYISYGISHGSLSFACYFLPLFHFDSSHRIVSSSMRLKSAKYSMWFDFCAIHLHTVTANKCFRYVLYVLEQRIQPSYNTCIKRISDPIITKWSLTICMWLLHSAFRKHVLGAPSKPNPLWHSDHVFRFKFFFLLLRHCIIFLLFSFFIRLSTLRMLWLIQ